MFVMLFAFAMSTSWGCSKKEVANVNPTTSQTEIAAYPTTSLVTPKADRRNQPPSYPTPAQAEVADQLAVKPLPPDTIDVLLGCSVSSIRGAVWPSHDTGPNSGLFIHKPVFVRVIRPGGKVLSTKSRFTSLAQFGGYIMDVTVVPTEGESPYQQLLDQTEKFFSDWKCQLVSGSQEALREDRSEGDLKCRRDKLHLRHRRFPLVWQPAVKLAEWRGR